MMLVQSRPIENTGLVATIVSPKSAQACLDFPLLSPNFGRFPIFANSNKATFEGTVFAETMLIGCITRVSTIVTVLVYSLIGIITAIGLAKFVSSSFCGTVPKIEPAKLRINPMLKLRLLARLKIRNNKNQRLK